MNYCFQMNEKYLSIFSTKDLIKQMKYQKNYYGSLKFIVNSSVLETDLSELKYLVAFLDSIKKREIWIEKRQKQEEFNRYLRK